MRLDLLACARSVSLVLCLAGAGSKMPRPGGSGLSPPANAAPRAAKTHVQGAVCVVRSPSCRLTTGARGSPPVKKAGPLFSDFGAAMRGEVTVDMNCFIWKHPTGPFVEQHVLSFQPFPCDRVIFFLDVRRGAVYMAPEPPFLESTRQVGQ